MIKILDSNKVGIEEILERKLSDVSKYEKTVSEIIENVKANGDKALYEYAKKFDGVELESLVVSDKEWEDGISKVEKSFMKVLKEASLNIEKYHEKQIKTGYALKKENGAVLGQIVQALEKVGIYVPGGSAAYPSTVLMNAIPAKLAGVEKIIMVTPPRKDGTILPEILAAAKLAGVYKIVKIGGAGAVAALAYGTESVEKVDKIVGPGNIFVALAKKQVFGQVAIDMIAGPSEILVIADDSANAAFVAADLLSQAEHDVLASSILLTPSSKLSKAVSDEINAQLKKLSREEIATKSIKDNGKIIIVKDLDEAFDISNQIAPEHLELAIEKPFQYLDKVKNAGSIFLGHYTPEPLGDYFAGTNHTLPTSGTARFSSPLSVDDFIKKSSYLYYTKEALEKDAESVISFAKKEGFEAHANSIKVRLDD